MEGVRQDTPAARYVAQNLKSETFVLVDVGCSGGLDNGWRSFGDRLQAVGFDPSIDEVERLNEAEPNPLVKYYAGFVGVPATHALRPQLDAQDMWGRNISASLSCYKTVEVRQQVQYEKSEWVASEARAVDQRIADPANPIFLPDFLAEKGLTSVDFIKIDVDGADYIILQGMQEALEGVQALGVGIEVNYFGSDRSTENVFHNVDRLMRGHSFGLFDLSVRHYSSASLPWPYSLPHPYAAQSVRGRPYQGDALYVRDSAVQETRPIVDAYSPEKLAKLVAVFAVFNLPDQAAEICDRYRPALSTVLDVDHLLDLLALQIQEENGGQLTYAEYMAAFYNDDPMLYGGSVELKLHAKNTQIAHLVHDMAVAKHEVLVAKGDVDNAQAWVESLKRDLEATQQESQRHGQEATRLLAELNTAQQELNQARQQARELTAELDNARRELAAVGSDAARLAGERDDLSQTLDRAQKDHADARDALIDLRRELANVIGSRTWRMTQGVRNLVTKVRTNR